MIVFHYSRVYLQAELAKCKTADDLTGKNGLVQRLIGSMLEQMLQKEMDEHLGYEKHSPNLYNFLCEFLSRH
jgi:transposase-like protein